jgi:hypothetical protein
MTRDDDARGDGEWWTPTGWRNAPEPMAWLTASEGTDLLWREALRNNGYEWVFAYGNVSDFLTDVAITVWRHSVDRHLLVELDTDEVLFEFFVDRAHVAAFMVDKLPGLIAGYHAVNGWDPEVRSDRDKAARKRQMLSRGGQ